MWPWGWRRPILYSGTCSTKQSRVVAWGLTYSQETVRASVNKQFKLAQVSSSWPNWYYNVSWERAIWYIVTERKGITEIEVKHVNNAVRLNWRRRFSYLYRNKYVIYCEWRRRKRLLGANISFTCYSTASLVCNFYIIKQNLTLISSIGILPSDCDFFLYCMFMLTCFFSLSSSYTEKTFSIFRTISSASCCTSQTTMSLWTPTLKTETWMWRHF